MNRILIFITISLPGFLAAQWVQVPSPSNNDLYNLYFINDSVGFAGEGNSEIVTYDGGRSWSMNPGFTDLAKACFVDSLNGFGITENNFYQTFDGGANWVSIKDSVEITRFSLLECVNGKVFVVGNKTLRGDAYWYASDNIGTSWEMRYMEDSIMYFQGRFLDDENIFGFAASRILNDPTDIMFHYVKSTDGGYTWQSIDFAPIFTTHNQVNYIYCSEIDSCFTAASFFGFGINTFRYTISRLDFSTGVQDTLLHKTQNAVNFLEGFGNSIFTGGGGFLKVSPDRGLNWYNQDLSFLLNPQLGLMACYVFNDSSAIVIGSVGCIIRTDNFGLGLSKASLPQPNFSVFPNPSNDYQDITLSELTPNTFCSIELFDLRGNLVKQVYSGLSKSSNLEIRVDLSNLAAGSYFYRVQTEAGVSQKKVVVY